MRCFLKAVNALKCTRGPLGELTALPRLLYSCPDVRFPVFFK